MSLCTFEETNIAHNLALRLGLGNLCDDLGTPDACLLEIGGKEFLELLILSPARIINRRT